MVLHLSVFSPRGSGGRGGRGGGVGGDTLGIRQPNQILPPGMTGYIGIGVGP